MDTRTLGSSGPAVSAIGLGCMGMSPDLYGPADEDESVATIHAATDAGITLLDTGDFYGMGHNEMLISRALQERKRDDVLISVKFGAQRGPDGAWLGYDARPQALKTALAYTLRRLRTDHVDVYRPARLDQAVPIEETAGAISELIEAGYVRRMGLSEVGADTIRRAHAVTPICDLQIEYSLISRGIEAEILPTCRELGIGVTAYGVLSRGLISGHWTAGAEGERDFRAHSPRFARGNVERNLELVEALRAIAGERGVTVAQLAIAWVLDRGEDIVPLIGARRRDRLEEALGALAVELTAEDRERIEAAVPAGGTLVLAAATFAAVRSSNASARIAEAALAEQRRPILVNSRLDDATQKIGFADGHWLRIDGGHAALAHENGNVYLAMSLRNVGAGIAVLQGWYVWPDQQTGRREHAPVEEFRTQGRDIVVPAGDIGLWQGAIRDRDDEGHSHVAAALREHHPLSIDVLYGDNVGGQRSVSRFGLVPASDGSWLATVSRHWNLDGPALR